MADLSSLRGNGDGEELLDDYKEDYEEEDYRNNRTDHWDHSTMRSLGLGRMVWQTVFAGLFVWLMLWALTDIFRSGRLKKDFFVKVFFVFGLFLLWDVAEYFIFYDLHFFQTFFVSQELAYAVEFLRCTQRTLIFGLGLVELVRLCSVSSTASGLTTLSGLASSWLLLLSMGFLLPAGLLAFHVAMGHNSMFMEIAEYGVLPLLISTVLFFWMYSKAKQLSFHFNLEEIAGTKLVLTFLLVILVESVQFLLLEELIWALRYQIAPHHIGMLLAMVRDCLHDVNRLLPPLSYLLLFRQVTWAAEKWLPAVNNPSLERLGPLTSSSAAESDRSRAAYDAEMNSLVFSDIDNY